MSDARPAPSRLDILNSFSHKSSYRPPSSFSHSHLVPDASPEREIPTMPVVPFGAPSDARMSSRRGAESPVSVFDAGADSDGYEDNAPLQSGRGIGNNDDDDDLRGSYDLKPPPPKHTHGNMEQLALKFFSVDHLNVILRDQRFAHRFSTFLRLFRPSLMPLLTEYLNTQKAIAAVEYANAIADNLAPVRSKAPSIAASLEDGFDQRSQAIVQDLVAEALPAFLTHRLVHTVTDTLVKEITGQSTPLMREMIPSLAEVYCVSDPSLPDNPIVYASEEFYNTSQYGKDYAIGRNCRFLQGPKTADASVKRLVEALADGREVNETILNYRRDGTPFLNLLMIAPLYDNKGAVRYFVGAQIDVSSLIEDGRGFDSFEQLLVKDRVDSRLGHRQHKKPAEILSELGAMLDNEELGTMKAATLRMTEDNGGKTTPSRSARGGRKILGMEDEAADRALWPDRSLGSSGRLPGVYQNYLLVRPFPSLRITFTSPALRIPGLLQTKFMERIGGPAHVREGILDAMSHGSSVTAKVNWIPLSGSSSRGVSEPRQRWIHCTPLLGSDDKVGVWMVVMVESEEVTGKLNAMSLHNDTSVPNSPRPGTNGTAGKHFTSEKLYQEYLRREGREGRHEGVGTFSRSSSKG